MYGLHEKVVFRKQLKQSVDMKNLCQGNSFQTNVFIVCATEELDGF